MTVLTILAISGCNERLLDFLQKTCCNILTDRYKITEGMSAYEALLQIADVRKCVKKGNEPDTEKAARCLLEDLRSSKLGRITLETPEE